MGDVARAGRVTRHSHPAGVTRVVTLVTPMGAGRALVDFPVISRRSPRLDHIGTVGTTAALGAHVTAETVPGNEARYAPREGFERVMMNAVHTQSGFFPALTKNILESENVLLDGLLANRPAAWRAFQVRYDRLILRCITKVTRRFSALVSQDDVREIYSTLYVSLLANDMHKLRSFDPDRGNRFSSWIGLLAINAAYDYLRTVRREPHKESLYEAMDLSCEMPDPFERASDNEQAHIAHKTLKDFSEKDRTFASLYFGEGMEPQAIAAKMNISVKTVYSKKHKIQSRLELVLASKARTRKAAA